MKILDKIVKKCEYCKCFEAWHYCPNCGKSLRLKDNLKILSLISFKKQYVQQQGEQQFTHSEEYDNPVDDFITSP